MKKAPAEELPVHEAPPGDGTTGGAAGGPGSGGGSLVGEAPRPSEGSEGTERCSMELAKATSKLSGWEPVAFYLNPRIRPTIVELVDATQVSLCVTQCYVSDDALVNAMVRAVRDRGVRVGMVVDHGQALRPASSYMPDQLRLLSEWGIEIRTYQAPGGATALMHAKSWLADD